MAMGDETKDSLLNSSGLKNFTSNMLKKSPTLVNKFNKLSKAKSTPRYD